MARSSGEYYAEYKKQKELAEDYEKYAKKVQEYKDNLVNKCDDEIADINKKIDDLQGELKTAIRHNSIFDNNAADLDNEREKSVTSGSSGLSGAVSDLTAEHSDLIRKKGEAEDARDQAYRDYDNAKEAEKQALIDAAKDLFGF